MEYWYAHGLCKQSRPRTVDTHWRGTFQDTEVRLHYITGLMYMCYKQQSKYSVIYKYRSYTLKRNFFQDMDDTVLYVYVIPVTCCVSRLSTVHHTKYIVPTINNYVPIADQVSGKLEWIFFYIKLTNYEQAKWKSEAFSQNNNQTIYNVYI